MSGSATIDVYECDGCGLCCSGRLLVEADAIDVLREPRINSVYPIRGRSVSLPISECTWILAPGKPCAFLDADRRCSIYATRPDACVSFMAGTWKCQSLRRSQGLAELRPATRPHTESNELAAECHRAATEEERENGWEG